ncbi:hypothetical protein AAY42_09990 [Flagellimonas eckloniae]|uniref:Uncharacterized protein n=1 Tax=Flagellimonas eckloniae TaxID=346185 RepID=A0A0Q0WXG1_9FLAO|nr:hypothetical protein [Allomuricauda eckloniae]KQC30170.1 hypothetical protein AAY42_09990 [Allomuricauda eckloniae]
MIIALWIFGFVIAALVVSLFLLWKKQVDVEADMALNLIDAQNHNEKKRKQLIDALLLQDEAMAKIRDETPRLEINENNEAVMYTRKGQEIYNWKLDKK